MKVIQEIAKWTKSLPDWESDAIRRIFIQEELTEEDENDIVSMLFLTHKLEDASRQKVTPVPFSKVLEPISSNTPKVLLKEIHTVENVNALVPGQSLKFALDGLTIVYGENGAGKSGYARVFKHSCQAREKSDPILTDISKPTKGKPTAIIELLVEEENVALRWQAGVNSSDLLSQIAVFDSHCARVFIDQANDIVYLPYGLDVFARLAALCNSVKARISSESKVIPATYDHTGEYSESSKAGRFVRTLSSSSEEKLLEQFAELSSKDVERLGELRVLVATNQTDSPKAKASDIRRTKSRFASLKSTVAAVDSAFSKEALANLLQCKAAAETAKKASILASNEAFRNEPLKGTGTEAWQMLFESARKFSTNHAYSDEDFPVVRTDAVCVLCQQSFTDDARQRMIRFEQYIRDNAAMQSIKASAALQKAMSTVSDLKLKPFIESPTLLEEFQSYDPTLAEKIVAYFQLAQAFQENTVSLPDQLDQLVTQYDNLSPATLLEAAMTALEAKAQQYESTENPEELKRIKEELAELEDRNRLKQQIEPIRNFIRLKQREVKLKACEKALDTAHITKKSSALMEEIVTDQLRLALINELEQLGVVSAPVQIKKVGEKGKTKFQLFVSNSSKPSGILSEGEQRIIAISSFLAELSTNSSISPIVFDDPVSSLDHRYREKVATRLVAECKQRQVVIFTHDVVLLLALEREAKEQRVPLQIQTVSKSPNGPGECLPSVPRPWYACNTKERLSQLKNEIAGYKKLQTENSELYRKRVASFYGKLRETWERLVEEILLNDVIQRFRPSIETQRLKRVTIEMNDYVEIEHGMSKCSTWIDGHDSAAALNTPTPNPDELTGDLKSLEEFAKSLRDRADKTTKLMGELLDAPAPKISDIRASSPIHLA